MESTEPVKARPWVVRLIVGQKVRVTLARAAVIAVIAFLLFRFVFLPVRIHGKSMEPAYRHRRLNAVNALAFAFRDPRRGDVVAIRRAGRSVMLLKRVVGLPGERIRIEGGVVYLDDQVLVERYVLHRSPWNLKERTLGPDEYFVIGDNRGMPQELHEFGAAHRERILGKAVF